MSILSDREIKMRCQRPLYLVYKGTKEEMTDRQMLSADLPLEKVKHYVDSANLELFQTNNLEEYINKHNPEVREDALKNAQPLWTTLEHIPEDQDISDDWRPMITPFVERSVKLDEQGRTIPSYGLGSYSYDVRLGRNFKLFKADLWRNEVLNWCGDQNAERIIDTANKNPTEGLMKDFNDVDYIDIPPGGFALGHTVEHVDVYRDLLVTCMAKSSIARMGLSAYVTPLEPEWKGYITIEMSNLTPHTIRVWAGIGIMALVFHKADNECEVSYADRGGKYQDQEAKPIETVN